MKKILQKTVALLSCITIMMSISSKVYADSYKVDSASCVALCSTDETPVPKPCPYIQYVK